MIISLLLYTGLNIKSNMVNQNKNLKCLIKKIILKLYK